VEDCEQLLRNGFIFQQDGALGYAAGVTQERLKSNCSDFITKDKWLPIHSISIHWIITFWRNNVVLNKLQPKPKRAQVFKRHRRKNRGAVGTEGGGVWEGVSPSPENFCIFISKW